MENIEKQFNKIAIDLGIILGVIIYGFGFWIFPNKLLMFFISLFWGLGYLLLDFIKLNRIFTSEIIGEKKHG